MSTARPSSGQVVPPEATGRRFLDVGMICTRGVTAGLFGGFAFILANMWFSAAHGKPAVAPLLAISTIFHGSAMPEMQPAEVVIGLVTHFALSLVFGVVFAAVVAFLRLAERPLVLVGAGLAYGLLLYLVNFQILSRLFFPWFVNPNGPNQLFELWIHPIGFGLFLVPFFLATSSAARR